VNWGGKTTTLKGKEKVWIKGRKKKVMREGQTWGVCNSCVISKGKRREKGEGFCAGRGEGQPSHHRGGGARSLEGRKIILNGNNKLKGMRKRNLEKSSLLKKLNSLLILVYKGEGVYQRRRKVTVDFNANGKKSCVFVKRAYRSPGREKLEKEDCGRQSGKFSHMIEKKRRFNS